MTKPNTTPAGQDFYSIAVHYFGEIAQKAPLSDYSRPAISNPHFDFASMLETSTVAARIIDPVEEAIQANPDISSEELKELLGVSTMDIIFGGGNATAYFMAKKRIREVKAQRNEMHERAMDRMRRHRNY